MLAAFGAWGCGASLPAATSGQIGCPESDITISNEEPGFFNTTWTAECRGKRFYCSRVNTGANSGVHGTMSQINCTPEVEASSPAPPPQPPAPPPKVTDPPAGAAGFSFGTTANEVSRVCTEAAKAWTPVESDGERFSCSGTVVDIGVPASAGLRFCGKKLCTISLVVAPKDGGKNIANSFIALREALSKKYGPPARIDRDVPSECMGDKDMPSCLRDGRARFDFAWRWPTGESVNLVIGRSEQDGGQVAVRVVYARPPTTVRANAEGL
jgi:hypothetical protein